MMKKINIGILGIQGDIEEHVASVKSAFREITIDGIVSVIKYPEEIDSIHGLITVSYTHLTLPTNSRV